MQMVKASYVLDKLLISKSTLERMARRGEVTKHTISQRCVRYSKSEIDQIFKSRCGNESGNENHNL